MEVSLIEMFSGEFDTTTKVLELRDLDDKLKSYFNSRNYGNDICSYLIGVICVHPKFDSFFKIGRPQYIEEKTVTYERILGPTHIYKSFSFRIKLDYPSFIKSNTKDGLKMIATLILESVKNIKYPRKIRDFDKERFYGDLKAFFELEKIV